MKKLQFVVMALGAVVAFGACGATIPKADQVKIFAARDLRCDRDQVQTMPVDDRTMRVNGCGQEVTYTEECLTSGTTRCTWVAHRSTERTNAGGSAPLSQ